MSGRTDSAIHTPSRAPSQAPRFATMFNPVTRRLLAAGVPLGPNVLMTVPGRTSGLPRTTPLAIIEDAGRRWIWSPWGDVQWVRNLRAAGHATITIGGHGEAVTVTELDRDQRVGFFRDVLGPIAHRMRFGVRFIRTVDQTDVDDPVDAAEGRAVFELHPVVSEAPGR